MGVRKISVSIPEEIADQALADAARRGVGLSAWLTEAVRERLERERTIDVGYRAARELVVEYEAEHGPIPAEAHEWAQAVLAGADTDGAAGFDDAAHPQRAAG